MRRPKSNWNPVKVWWQPFALAGASLFLLWAISHGVPSVSPRQMVRDLATRGEAVSPISTLPPTYPSSATSNTAAKALSTQPHPAGLTGDKTSGHYFPVSFTQLSSFQFRVTDDLINPPADATEANQKIREQIPDGVWKLSEKDISLTGFMLPVQLKNGLATDFMLLPNQMSCCYGVKPRINEWVIVHTTGKGVKAVMDMIATRQRKLAELALIAWPL